MSENKETNVGWQRQDKVYIIMYQSKRSGGTYTEVRRTEAGFRRLIETLLYMGYNRSDISVSEQKKLWMPVSKKELKKKKLKTKVRSLGVETREQRAEEKPQLHDGRRRTYIQ